MKELIPSFQLRKMKDNLSFMWNVRLISLKKETLVDDICIRFVKMRHKHCPTYWKWNLDSLHLWDWWLHLKITFIIILTRKDSNEKLFPRTHKYSLCDHKPPAAPSSLATIDFPLQAKSSDKWSTYRRWDLIIGSKINQPKALYTFPSMAILFKTGNRHLRLPLNKTSTQWNSKDTFSIMAYNIAFIKSKVS